MISAFVVTCLFATALAQLPEPQNCPDVGRVKNFNNTRFMGKWYSAKSPMLRRDISCSSDNYVIENGVLYKKVEFRLRFPVRETNGRTLGPPVQIKRKSPLLEIHLGYHIIATDYTSYAIYYACYRVGPEIVISIRTRERHPSEEVLRKALDILKEKVGDVIMYDVDQSNCEQPLQEVSTTIKPGWKTF